MKLLITEAQTLARTTSTQKDQKEELTETGGQNLFN
jgi:hypothetical protein